MHSEKAFGYLLARGLRILKIRVVSHFREKGIELTFDQFVILQILNSNSGIIQRDLANHLQKDKSVIVRQINCLLGKELIERHAGEEDKRKKNLVLTKKGKIVLNQMQEIRSEVSKSLLAGVSETDFETFRNVLTRIRENGESGEDQTCKYKQSS